METQQWQDGGGQEGNTVTRILTSKCDNTQKQKTKLLRAGQGRLPQEVALRE